MWRCGALRYSDPAQVWDDDADYLEVNDFKSLKSLNTPKYFLGVKKHVHSVAITVAAHGYCWADSHHYLFNGGRQMKM